MVVSLSINFRRWHYRLLTNIKGNILYFKIKNQVKIECFHYKVHNNAYVIKQNLEIVKREIRLL